MEKAVTKVETGLEQKRDRNLPALLSELTKRPGAMAAFQVAMSAPGRHVGNESTTQLLSTGAIDLFSGLAPADATETLLSMLAVSVANASMDCLMQAASMSPKYLDGRDLNLRHGFKGAAVAAELIKVLDARRGNSEPRSVTVRDVNVEAGAQALIGNVEAPRRKDRPEPRGSEPLAQQDEPQLEGGNG